MNQVSEIFMLNSNGRYSDKSSNTSHMSFSFDSKNDVLIYVAYMETIILSLI